MYNSDTNDYSVKFVPSSNNSPSILYLNYDIHYPNGYEVSCAEVGSRKDVEVSVELVEKNQYAVKVDSSVTGIPV